MTPPFITPEDAEPHLDWLLLTEALAAGHRKPKAEIGDTFLYRAPDTLLSRAAWIDGLGSLVKTATVFPENTDLPAINGAVSLFDDKTGMLSAMLDFHLVTKWKTAGDSLLAAQRLARPDSRNILIVGAGTVGASLIDAFHIGFPDAHFHVWNRTTGRAEDLVASTPHASLAKDLENAVQTADIIVSATMSKTPVIRGDWLQPGQHLNLIGAYRPDMREVDDLALTRSRVFTDSFDTTLDHIGEFKIPIEDGVINREDVIADYYQLDKFDRSTDGDVTLFKNGGGAHLDLMTCAHILKRWQNAQ